MIRADRFALDVDTFAAERRRILERSDERFAAAVRASLTRLGLPGWENNIVEMALDIFDETAREEVDEWNPIIDDMREEFERELRETLAKTKPDEKFDAQVERLTRWLSTYSINAGTEAATTSDPDGAVGLEWVTMGDNHVRETHVEANGETVPSGQPFDVAGYELLYPGQPVGPPEIWINCRCVARPTMLEEFKVKTTEFAVTAAVEEPEVPVEEEDEDAPEEIPEEEQFEPVPWYGVLAPEGTPSGDGRQFDVNGLTHRDLPLPLKAMFVDDEGHKGSVIVGRIDNIFRDGGLVKGEGVFDGSEAAYETIRMLAEGMWRGVSVDIDDMQAQLSEDGSVASATGRICAATICAIPAFAEAFVGLGTWADAQVDSAHGRDANTGLAAAATTVELAQGTENRDMLAVDRDEEHGGLRRVREAAKDGAPAGVGGTSGTDPRGGGSGSREGAGVRLEALREPGASGAGAAEDERTAGRFAVGGGVSDGGLHERSSEERVRGAAGREGSLSEVRSGSFAGVPASQEGEFAPVPIRTKDGPGWITDPVPTRRITDYWVDGRGALKIRWGTPNDFNRCRRQLVKYVQNPKWLAGLCANLHYRALHVWPGQHSGGTVTLTAAAASDVLDGRYFKNPELIGPTPFTVTEDGRVYGHVATWDTCHIGLPIGDSEGECTTAPHSSTNYAFFLTGEVLTDLGPVNVGQITLGGGHADGRASLRAAIGHYDSTSTAVADVTAGEDEHGIWVAGVLRPNVTPEQVRELRAAAISGDWRQVRAGREEMELIAALAVNVPGFPIPRPSMLVASSGQPLSLVAAAIPLHSGQDAGNVIEMTPSATEKFNAARAKFRQLEITRAKSVFAVSE